METTIPTNKITIDDIWALFKEVGQELKEIGKLQKETDKKFQDTDKKFQDTDKKFQDTDKIFKDTDKKIKGLAELFTGQWGKLIEALIEPACIKLFQNRGIEISQTLPNAKARQGGRHMECDVLLVNNTEIVVIEVKTTFQAKYVKQFIQQLKEFKTFFPQYSNYKVYGAIAAIKFNKDVDNHAYRNGLFVMKNTGEGIFSITNDKEFKPQVFA